jgi:Uma2 family endonuclease
MAALAAAVPLTRRPLYKLSIEQYHQMIQSGVLRSGEKVELLEGYLVEKVPRNPPHDGTLYVVQEAIRPFLSPAWVLRVQSAITLPDSEPEPDLVIACGPPQQYFEHHPGPAEVALVIEVSDTTLEDDRVLMQRIYARARIPVYWIVNIPDRQLEVHTQPRAGKNPTYRHRQVFTPPDSVSLTLGTTVVGPVPVANLLPPVSPS